MSSLKVNSLLPSDRHGLLLQADDEEEKANQKSEVLFPRRRPPVRAETAYCLFAPPMSTQSMDTLLLQPVWRGETSFTRDISCTR